MGDYLRCACVTLEYFFGALLVLDFSIPLVYSCGLRLLARYFRTTEQPAAPT